MTSWTKTSPTEGTAQTCSAADSAAVIAAGTSACAAAIHWIGATATQTITCSVEMMGPIVLSDLHGIWLCHATDCHYNQKSDQISHVFHCCKLFVRD